MGSRRKDAEEHFLRHFVAVFQAFSTLLFDSIERHVNYVGAHKKLIIPSPMMAEVGTVPPISFSFLLF